MKFHNLFVVAFVLMLVTACGSKKDQLAGKWSVSNMEIPGMSMDDLPEDAKAEFEKQIQSSSFDFKKDGTFSGTLAGETRTGTWELNEEATVLTTTSEEGEAATFDLTEFSKEKIVMTMKQEGEEVFTLTLVPAE